MAAKKKIPQLKIVYRKVEDLLPYKNNSREHSPEQIDELVDSMTEFDFYNPIKLYGDTIVAGHGRLMAAKKKGMEKVPTIPLDYLSKKQVQKLVIADNQLALNATWNIEVLREELFSIINQGDVSELDVLGFDEKFVADLLDETGPTEKQLKEQEYFEKYNIVIECKDEMDQFNAYEKLKKMGYTCQVQSL